MTIDQVVALIVEHDRMVIRLARYGKQIEGTLGWLRTSTYTFDVPGKTGFKYVTLQSGTIVEAYNRAGVADTDALPVLLDKNVYGQFEIIREAFTGL